jgi:hypothetical protein
MSFILYMIPECSRKALEMNKKVFQGRIIKVLEAEPKPKTGAQLLHESDSTSYKVQFFFFLTFLRKLYKQKRKLMRMIQRIGILFS